MFKSKTCSHGYTDFVQTDFVEIKGVRTLQNVPIETELLLRAAVNKKEIAVLQLLSFIGFKPQQTSYSGSLQHT